MTMTKNILLLTTAILAIPATFDPAKTGWKLDADGKLEMKDGNPIYIDTKGQEMVTEPGTISRLNAEAQANREGRQTAEDKLRTFEGIDPVIAKKAIKTVADIDAKTLIDAGELDRVKAEVGKQFQAQIDELKTENGTLKTNNESILKDSAFASSQWVSKNIAVPLEMFQTTFGKNVKIEKGKPVAVDAEGNRILSKSRVGDYADFDEAMEILVDGYGQKETILVAETKSGSGNKGKGGDVKPGSRTMQRSDFNELPVMEQAALGPDIAKGDLTVVAD